MDNLFIFVDACPCPEFFEFVVFRIRIRNSLAHVLQFKDVILSYWVLWHWQPRVANLQPNCALVDFRNFLFKFTIILCNYRS